MFAAPSPKNSNNAQLFLTKAGHLVDKHGRDWGRSSMKRMAQDAALSAPPDSIERNWGPADWAASHARRALSDAIEKAAEAHGLTDDEHKALLDLVDEHLSGEMREAGKGKGAVDDEGDVDEDEVEERVRKFLAEKGLDADDIEEALERVKADRAAAKDRLPVPATKGGMGGYRSGRSKDRYDETDFMRDHPESVTTADPYGEPNSERLMRDADPVRAEGERISSRLPGGGVTRRGHAGDMAFDKELTRLIDNVKVGMWG